MRTNEEKWFKLPQWYISKWYSPIFCHLPASKKRAKDVISISGQWMKIEKHSLYSLHCAQQCNIAQWTVFPSIFKNSFCIGIINKLFKYDYSVDSSFRVASLSTSNDRKKRDWLTLILIGSAPTQSPTT